MMGMTADRHGPAWGHLHSAKTAQSKAWGRLGPELDRIQQLEWCQQQRKKGSWDGMTAHLCAWLFCCHTPGQL
jgi:hypothetical protein